MALWFVQYDFFGSSEMLYNISPLPKKSFCTQHSAISPCYFTISISIICIFNEYKLHECIYFITVKHEYNFTLAKNDTGYSPTSWSQECSTVPHTFRSCCQGDGLWTNERRGGRQQLFWERSQGDILSSAFLNLSLS